MSWLLWREDRAYLVDPGDRLETDLGILTVPDGLDPGATVKTHLGEAFTVLRPRPTDFFAELDRSGAPLLPRDVGLIVGLAGITAGDRVLDVGTGTGILAITLASLGAEVETYERDPEAAETARANVAIAGVTDAVTVHEADATAASPDGHFDAVTLDTGDAPALAGVAPDLLVPGGMVAAYSPFIENARATVEALRDADMRSIRTLEPFHREMDFGPRGSRPSTAPVGHTGYLTLARYLPDTA